MDFVSLLPLKILFLWFFSFTYVKENIFSLISFIFSPISFIHIDSLFIICYFLYFLLFFFFSSWISVFMIMWLCLLIAWLMCLIHIDSRFGLLFCLLIFPSFGYFFDLLILIVKKKEPGKKKKIFAQIYIKFSFVEKKRKRKNSWNIYIDVFKDPSMPVVKEKFLPYLFMMCCCINFISWFVEMDDNDIFTFLLASEMHTKLLYISFAVVGVACVFSAHYYKHNGLRNHSFVRHETRIQYLDSIIGQIDIEYMNQ